MCISRIMRRRIAVTRALKPGQLLLAGSVQRHSARALMRGHIFHSYSLPLQVYSVQLLPCPPRM